MFGFASRKKDGPAQAGQTPSKSGRPPAASQPGAATVRNGAATNKAAAATSRAADAQTLAAMTSTDAMGCPVVGPAKGPQPLAGGRPGESDYEKYMRVGDLLSLQKPEDQLVHHDEMMFQAVHQSFEIWCKLVLIELRSVRKLVEADRLVEAYPLIQRCTEVVKLNTSALHVLETMTPWDFHVIRAALGQGSGAESPGFRDIQQQAPRMWPAVEALLKRRKTDLLAVYTNPNQNPDLLRLLENLTDFDMFFHIWRLNHLAMVKRVIGRDVKSLKGYAVHQLETDVNMVLWPALWKVRNSITDKAGTSPP